MVQQILSSTPPLAEQIRRDPENKEYTEQGWEPVYSASPRARIVVIGQAPGRAAQESRIRGTTRAVRSCASGWA